MEIKIYCHIYYVLKNNFFPQFSINMAQNYSETDTTPLKVVLIMEQIFLISFTKSAHSFQ